MFRKIGAFLVVLLTISGVVGVIYSLDGRWAKAEEVVLLAQRLDMKILGDKADRLQSRIWAIEDRHGSPNKIKDPVVLQEYREILREIKDINNQLRKPPRP